VRNSTGSAPDRDVDRSLALGSALGFALLVCLLFAAPARGAERVTIFDPGEPIWHAESVGPTLDRLRALGTDVVRLRVAYAEEPDLEPLDRAIGGAMERDMEVMLVPVGPAPSVAAYADFVGALGRRYPEVRRWAIYNEPDLPSWFPLPSASPSPPPPPPGVLVPNVAASSTPAVAAKKPPTPEYTLGRAYRETFVAAQRGLVAAGHDRREVLIGDTSPCVNPDFIRGTLHGRGLIAGGWAHHPYIAADRPWETAPCFGPADLPRLRQLLVEAARAGGTKGVLPIYVTEFGVFDSQSPAMLAASEWVMSQPYVRSFAQYTLRDDWFEAGLLRSDGSPKPSLSVFADPIFVRRLGTRVQIWGHLRTLPHSAPQDVCLRLRPRTSRRRGPRRGRRRRLLQRRRRVEAWPPLGAFGGPADARLSDPARRRAIGPLIPAATLVAPLGKPRREPKTPTTITTP
jgi:hypothetical protein